MTDVVFVLLAAVILLLLVAVFRLYKQVANSKQLLQHELQTLRYEMNAKIHPLEKRFYQQLPGAEAVVYDGRGGIEAADFSANCARAWDYVAHRFSDGEGEGSYQINGNAITLNRTNTAGRYELYLRRFVFHGVRSTNVPESTVQSTRHLRFSFEVKKGPASHLLRFVFKGELSKEVLDEKDYVVFNPDWEKADVFFTVSTAENSLFRIDDLGVMNAPGAIQLRNLVLYEKK